MRCIFTSFILLFCLYELRSQAFDKIEIVAQEHDEPPTREGRPVHQLAFHLNEEVLTLLSYKISNSSVSTNPVAISKHLVDSLSYLLNIPRTNFVIRREVGGEQLRSIELDLDSLNFCKSYIQIRTITTGGVSLKIKVKDGAKNLLNFEFDSSNPDNLDLQKFLTLYPVLQNSLPENLPGAYLFDDIFLMQKVTEYLETIKCEDYYYREFVDGHPERTPQQNRTREGWNFEEFMKNRNGS